VQADVPAAAGGPSGAALRKLLAKQGTRVLRVDGQLATIEASAAFLGRLARGPCIEAIARRADASVAIQEVRHRLLLEGSYLCLPGRGQRA